jgi:NAD-dependent deacetylase sirtuin 4
MIVVRLFKRAVELEKPIMILNIGPTRADPFVGRPQVEKVEWKAGEVLKAVGMLIA